MNTYFTQLEKYLESQGQKEKSKLLKNLTSFQLQVLLEISKIPKGETRTYKQIATAIGRPNSSRAVGSACGINPVLLTIPCHRVVRQNGHLGGYARGGDQKRLLLEQEGYVVPKN